MINSFSLTIPLDSKNSEFNLIVLHNNDMHARFDQTNRDTTECQPEDQIKNKCFGGMGRVSSMIKKDREDAKKNGTHVLYFNAGDTYTGTPMFALYKDKIVSEFMNILRPDAMVCVTVL